MERWQCSILSKSRVLIGSLSRRNSAPLLSRDHQGKSKENFWQSAPIIVHPLSHLALPSQVYPSSPRRRKLGNESRDLTYSVSERTRLQGSKTQCHLNSSWRPSLNSSYRTMSIAPPPTRQNPRFNWPLYAVR
jgi:hypothetical protein